MILTVFPGANSGNKEASSDMQRLDARVYTQLSEQDVSTLVNKVYEQAISLVHAAAPALLKVTTAAHLRDERRVHAAAAKAYRALQKVLDGAQDKMMQCSQECTGTPVQLQAARQMYTSFLRSMTASWTCASHLAAVSNAQVDAVQEEWLARWYVQQAHDLSPYTLHAKEAVARITSDMQEQLLQCVHSIELQRLQLTRTIAVKAQLPLCVHITTCKQFVAQVRQWAEQLKNSLPSPPPPPSFGAV